MGDFSKTYEGVVDVVISDCDIYTLDGKRKFHTDNAMWDTGSTCTFVSDRIIRALQLEPSGMVGVSGIGGDVDTQKYMIHISLPTGNVVTYFEVLSSEYEDYDVIIGMDIINRGHFSLDSSGENTVFFFSLSET